MKTSNIIITAFAILIIGGMLFLFVDSKKHKETEKNNFSYKEFPLASFNVIVAEKGSDVHIDRSDSTMIKVEYIKGRKTPATLYAVINDTLHVYGGLRTFVKCKQITQLIGNKPFWVGINNFAPDSLTIKAIGGQVNFNANTSDSKKNNLKLINLGIIATDSAQINTGNSRLGNFAVLSNNARIINRCVAKYTTVRLSNNAKFISLDNIEKIVVEKDTTCQIQITNQIVY